MKNKPSEKDTQYTQEAILASGCFWGVEALFKKLPGVLKTEVGYTGGTVDNPSYEQVCTKITGHVEAIRVVFDPEKVNYESIVKYFFETHDSTQSNGQGPDLGPQYLSQIHYYDEQQKQIALQVIEQLKQLGITPATTLHPIKTFWPAEDYHQDYYAKTGGMPYCHTYKKIF